MRGIWCASLSGEREAEKLRDVLQKFLQALARRVLDQHLRIAIFCNPAFVDKDQARSYFLGKTDFVGHDHHRHPFFSQILHNLQHFMAQFRVKSGSRFIKQHHFRLHRQRGQSPHAAVDHQKVRKGSDVHALPDRPSPAAHAPVFPPLLYSRHARVAGQT